MLQPAGILFGGLFLHAERDQAFGQQGVPLVNALRNLPAAAGQFDIAAFVYGNISVFAKLFHRVADARP